MKTEVKCCDGRKFFESNQQIRDACLNSISNKKFKKLIWVGAFDQLTHSDDSLINFTDWPDKIKKNYEQELGL